MVIEFLDDFIFLFKYTNSFFFFNKKIEFLDEFIFLFKYTNS